MAISFSTFPLNYYLKPKSEVKALVSNKKQRMKKKIIPMGPFSLSPLTLSLPVPATAISMLEGYYILNIK
jgi:hypothetical protein